MQQQESTTDFDILIVGGGMVGAAAACALSGLGLRLGLMDGRAFDDGDGAFRSSELRFDPRVSALAPTSCRLFESLGCWSAMAACRISPYTEMQVWDADGTGRVHFDAADIHADALGHIVENSVILHALYAKLARLDDVTLIAPATLESLLRRNEGDDSAVEVNTASGDTFTCRLLLGADGANSRVRELCGFRVREWDYQQQAIITTVRTELPHRQTAWQRFMATGPLAFLPLLPASGSDDQHFSSIVWSVVPERAAELMALTDAAFSRQLQQDIENNFGHIDLLDRRFAFPLQQRHAVDYVQDGIALIGDAAHTIHPLAGQGVNLGLADVRVLAEEIGDNLRQGRSINELRMLRRYQRRRVGHNLGMMWMMEGFKRLFAQQSLPLRWLRNAGMQGVDNSSLLKNRLIRQATGY